MVRSFYLARIAMVCVAVAAVVRAALFFLPEGNRQLGMFVAPFVYGAGVLAIGVLVGLPEFKRLLGVLRRGRR